MGATRLRYPSSGPYVTGDGGAPAEPGEGMVMRQERVTRAGIATLTAANIVLEPSITAIAVMEDSPPGMRYGVQLEAHLRANPEFDGAGWSSGEILQVVFEASTDDGATWLPHGDPVSVSYAPAGATSNDREGYNIDLTCSSDYLPVTGHVVRDDLQFRATVNDGGDEWHQENVLLWTGEPDTVFTVQEVL